MKTWLAGVVLLAVGCGKPTEAPRSTAAPIAEPEPVAGTAVITGRVTFHGAVPKPTPIRMGEDPYCQSAHSGGVSNEELLVNADGTLRNVFVYIKQGLGDRVYPAPKTPVVLDQAGCLYHPRVQGIQVGQPFLIRNDDDTLHNVHGMAEVNDAFNLAQPTRGMEARRVFTKPEVMLRFRCDVHPWMTAYLGIVPNPFYDTTGAGGAFTLKKLPAGQYMLEAWHEKLGTKTMDITLTNGETKTLEISFP